MTSRLKGLRKKNNLIVAEAAERSGIPRPTFEKWELLGVPEIVDYAVRIAGALGVEVCDLYEGGGGPNGLATSHHRPVPRCRPASSGGIGLGRALITYRRPSQRRRHDGFPLARPPSNGGGRAAISNVVASFLHGRP